METPKILRLYLIRPLSCFRDEGQEPFAPLPAGGEWLFCFEINPVQAFLIEPEGQDYLGPLVFRGKILPENIPEEGDSGNRLDLPAGPYYFAQERKTLSREETIFIAMELQKEALWERRLPGSGETIPPDRIPPPNRVYLRHLLEDGALVSQVLRPVWED